MQRSRHHLVGSLLAATLVVACGGAPREPAARPRAQAGAAARDVPATPPGATLRAGLGTYSRKVSTASPRAQRAFDDGLVLAYGFHHDEALRAFEEAAREDPGLAMARWGIALSCGPHINRPVVPPERARLALAALATARELVAAATPVERALVEAQGRRFSDDPTVDRATLDRAYAEAMRGLFARYPDDADVATLYAEALMILRPWDHWTADGAPQPGTEELVAVLERAIELSPAHPGAHHFYIHAVEASPHPERALRSAEQLLVLAPGVGHLVHMPSHIFMRLGLYARASEANRRALAADRAYLEARAARGGEDPAGLGFHAAYLAHNHQFLWASTLLEGRPSESHGAAREALSLLPETLSPELVAFVDPFAAATHLTLARFGRWDEVLAAPPPMPARPLPVSRGVVTFARGLAHLALGRPDLAREARASLRQEVLTLDPGLLVGNGNPARALLGIAESILSSEISRRAGRPEHALRHLARAVRLDDGLRYNEPPDWMLPPRHWLGALLLDLGRPAEAEAVYRADLARLPENGFALLGLSQALDALGSPEADDARERFRRAWARAEAPLESSRP